MSGTGTPVWRAWLTQSSTACASRPASSATRPNGTMNTSATMRVNSAGSQCEWLAEGQRRSMRW